MKYVPGYTDFALSPVSGKYRGGSFTNNATFILQVPNLRLPNAQSLNSLNTGILTLSSPDGIVLSDGVINSSPITNHALVVGSAHNSLSMLTMINGQVLIGNTGANPSGLAVSSGNVLLGTSGNPVSGEIRDGNNISWDIGTNYIKANLDGRIDITNLPDFTADGYCWIGRSASYPLPIPPYIPTEYNLIGTINSITGDILNLQSEILTLQFEFSAFQTQLLTQFAILEGQLTELTFAMAIINSQVQSLQNDVNDIYATTITLVAGDVTGSAVFGSSGSCDITTSLVSIGTAGTYSHPSSIITDAKGRITSITSGSAPTGGTVTSVGITGGTGFGTITGSPITTSGTINLSLNAELRGLSGMASNGIVIRTGAGTYTNQSITNRAVLVGGASNSITSLGLGTTGTVLAGSTGANPAFTAAPAGLTSIGVGSFTLSGTTLASSGNISFSTTGDGLVQCINSDLAMFSQQTIRWYGSNGNYAGIRANAPTINYIWVLPNADSSGFIRSNGVGTLSVETAVTSITAGTGLSGGTITGTGTIALSNTTVMAGTYTNISSLTANAQGQITAIASGSAPTGGTVTSVGITGGTGFGTITGSPITTSGTINLSLNAELQGLSGMASNGIVIRTGAGTYTNQSITNRAVLVGGASNSITSLSVGTTGQVLRAVTLGDPAWSAVTYPSSLTENALLYANIANNIGEVAVVPSAVLITDVSGVPGLQTLTNGQLIIGSTGSSPMAAVPNNGTNISWTTGAGTLQANLSGTVSVPLGGTGRSTLTNYGVLIGAGTSAISQLPAATSGTVLIGNTGANPSFSATLPSAVQSNITALGIISGGISSSPSGAISGTTVTIGTAYQNPFSTNIIMYFNLKVTSATSARIFIGTDSTASPVAKQVMNTFTTASSIYVQVVAMVPENYYVLISTTGTITISVDSQVIYYF